MQRIKEDKQTLQHIKLVRLKTITSKPKPRLLQELESTLSLEEKQAIRVHCQAQLNATSFARQQDCQTKQIERFASRMQMTRNKFKEYWTSIET
jgi:hypothetical protein